MIDRLEQMEQRYNDMQAQFSLPEVLNDHEKYQKTAKAMREIEAPVERYRELKQVRQLSLIHIWSHPRVVLWRPPRAGARRLHLRLRRHSRALQERRQIHHEPAPRRPPRSQSRG